MKIVNLIGKLPENRNKKYQKRKISDINYLAVHHSLTDNIPGGEDVFAFARYHTQDLDWPAIGYAYVIDADCIIYKCNPATVKTYHVGKHNKSALGICMVGDFRSYEPTPKQREALLWLLKTLTNAYNIPVENIRGHSEFSGYEWKKCPAIDMQEVRKDVKNYERKD